MGGPGQGKSTLCQYIAQVYRARITGHLKELGESSELLNTASQEFLFELFYRDIREFFLNQKVSNP